LGDTQVWLISKDDDIFEAKDRPNIPENKKPTKAQQTARLENIKKPSKLGGHAQRRKSRLHV
jgi:hypothetical protein